MRIKRDPAWQAEVGKRLVLARDAIGFNQVRLAVALKISAQRLSNYENGSRPFDLELAMELSRRFGITMDYIYRWRSEGPAG